MCLIWGVPYLFIKIAVDSIDPWTVALGRTAIGAALLVPIAAARGELRQVLPHWRWLLAFAVVEMFVPWVLLGFAETRLSSSLTGLLIAAVPMVGAVLARERIDGRRAVGLLVGV